MNRYLFLAIACIAVIAVHAQHATAFVPFSPDRLVPGYVVLNDGDTISGKIQLVGYQTALDYVYFSDEKSAARKFSVDDCMAFGTEGEI